MKTMDDNDSLVYGLEFQARALASQQAESTDVRFFVATQSLKPNNQLHVVDINEESFTLKTKVFSHPLGEVWKLNASPHDRRILASCYSVLKGIQTVMQTAILKLPEQLESPEDDREFLQFADVDVLNTEGYGSEIRTTEFHPTDAALLSTVIDGKVLLFNRTESSTKLVAEINAKNAPKFSGGRWSHFNHGNQFITLFDCSIRSYDVRDPNHCAWVIEDAHNQLVRDLDCNPNKQCHIVTGGDDGVMKIWDFRNTKEHIFARSDHHHWIWNVRFNTYHDQLLLSSSSDGKVLLTCASSVSSETLEGGEENTNSKEHLADGLLQTFDQHEDSVYCVEWSTADPWLFASLSYDGRVIVSKIPKQYKYQILFK
ncbi:EARP-interacting protein homolog [Toxorhynchites rutilus septentrionalis]|uniref:EARP-interacting protein homolog n=1 Tax=Toxorhynchites rutilus septentrionalis TaxID=329112 RepID=UPI0024797D7E|nr:EARP-interacting protein homolog [Toxorhynchites rutilus septentrionalis]